METEFERRIDARLIFSMIACGIMSCCGVIVETAMNITFPTLMSEFGVDTPTVQWITTGYLLVLTVIMPISAFLKRRFKMKALFVFAISAFSAGTIMCAAAPAFAFLIFGRVLQGVGTGVALPLMFNIVIDQSPVNKMGLMMGIATLITAIAPAIGPSLGGLIITYWGWRMIFVVLLPFLAFSAVSGVWAIRQATPTQEVHFRFSHFALIVCAFASIVFGVNAAATNGWLSAEVIGLLVAGILLLAIFAKVSKESSNPLLDVRIFKTRGFALSVCYVILISMNVLGLGYLIPYYAQEVCGQTALLAGCLLLPGCIIGAILAPMGGRILDRFGAERPIKFGAFCQLLAILLFIAFAFEVPIQLWALIYITVPIAQGFSNANSITNGLSYLPEAQKADGNSAINTLQQLGNALGTAITTTIVGSAQALYTTDIVAGTIIGAKEAFIAMLVIATIALASTLLVFKQKR